MRRMYSVRTFIEIAEKLKTRIPDFNLTTDIIVGFPGETEADFQETCKVSKDIGFSHIHTFKYSVRNGTRAARMEDQIPEKIKNKRSKIIRDLSMQNRFGYFNRMMGNEQTVLTEKSRKGIIKGYGEHFIPVSIEEEIPENSFVRVKLIGIENSKEPIMIGTSLSDN